MNRFSYTTLLSLVFAYSLTGCSTVEVYQYQYDSTLDEVFVKQGVDFSRYTSVMIDPVSVWYPDEYAPAPENVEKAQANLARAQNLFHETIADALDERFTVVDKPGKGVLRLHVEFVDLRAVPRDAGIPSELKRLDFKTRPGHISMTGELFDAGTGQQLARVADLGKQHSVGGQGVVDWEAIASDFEYWANIFSAWMDEVHGE